MSKSRCCLEEVKTLFLWLGFILWSIVLPLSVTELCGISTRVEDNFQAY